MLPLLVLGYIVAYLDRVNVGFAKLQMVQDLHLSETIYGFGAGIFFLGYFLFEVPSNIVLHRVGARRWLARIMISWGIVSAAMLFVRTAPAFYTLRFMLGVAEAGFFPGVVFYLTQWFPAERRGGVIAILMAAIAVCNIVGGVISGSIMQAFDGAHGLAGWQWLFLLEAAPAIVVGGYMLFHLVDNPGRAPWLDESEKSLLAADLARDARKALEGSYTDALRNWRVWFMCLICFCQTTGLYATSFWLPTIISEMGFTKPLHIGLLTAIPYVAAIVTMTLIARSADKRGERRWHLAVPAAVGSLGLVLSILFADQVVLAIAALSLAVSGILTLGPMFWTLPPLFLRGATAAAGIAVINSSAISVAS